MEQNRDDLLLQLRDQRDFLKSSSTAFDGGFAAEAKRLAVVIRVLVHDTPRSRSLLKLLGVKDQIPFVDSAGEVDSGNLIQTSGLCALRMSPSGSLWVPLLGDWPPVAGRGRSIPFDKWWTMRVMKDNNGQFFSRRDLVLGLANKDGGAHVDAILPPDYADLTRGNSLAWTLQEPGGRAVMIGQDPVSPSVRQIAFEVERSLAQREALFN